MAIIHGTSGNDNLVGPSANDSISGFDGNDTLDGGAGADTLTGGAGDDYYFVEADQIDTVVELAGEGTDTVETADDDFVLGANIENLVVTAQDVHIAQGNALNNEITGGSGFGYLAGEGGDDTLNAGDGGGVLFGGDGSDLLLGGAGDDDLQGDTMNSGPSTSPGNDTLDGGAGADTLTGGAGDDHYFVEADQIDTVVELAGEGTDTVETADDDFVLGANIENLVVTAQDVHIAQGNALNNEITGGSGFGYLAGEGGDDTLNAGDGGGVLFGGDGSDLLLGGAGDDDLQGDTMNRSEERR